jgi:actin-related protein
MILAERPYANHRMREELCEIMFECFHTPKLNISCQPILALYAQGTYSGLVVDVGHGKTSVTPVIAGCPIQQGMSQTKFAGQLLESLLSDYLRQDNHLRHIKEANCRVPPLTGRPDENAVGNFQLPDGTSIRMTQEAQNLGEVLFRKSDLPDFDTFLGLQSMVWNGIRHAPMDSRMIMAENIILVGGTTQLPGFADRLLEEVKLNVPEGMKAKLCVHQAKGAPPSKLDDAKKPAQVSAQVLPSLTAVWQGGRVLAGFNDSQSLWLNQDEYYEAGKGAIHKKTTM